MRGCRHEQTQVGVWADRAAPRLGAHALFYANRRPAILFFRDWCQLFALEEGESASVHSDAIRLVIAVLLPLVLVTTGWQVWHR